MATTRTIKAEEILNDVRAGMTDVELMEKHRLSAWGLQDLFDQMLRTGLIDRSELDRRMLSVDSTVDVRKVLEQAQLERAAAAAKERIDSLWKCPVCGTSHPREPERCSQCGVMPSRLPSRTDSKAPPEGKKGAASEQQQQAAAAPGEPAPKKRVVLAEDVIRDLKTGFTDAQLMSKYNLSVKGLQSLFGKLLASKFISRSDLSRRPRPGSGEAPSGGNGSPAKSSSPAQASIGPPESVPRDDRVERFLKQAPLVGKVKAALEAHLTVEEVCELWERDTKRTLALVSEACNRFDEIRRALTAEKIPPR